MTTETKPGSAGFTDKERAGFENYDYERAGAKIVKQAFL